jgi:bifunctional DNA-binding transcriptional regulator/antitoxin component of YhaV-PrlF toxin-antitoxin module
MSGAETFNRGKATTIVGRLLAVLKVDDRYRVLLDKEVRDVLKIAPGDKVLAIPYSDGVLITTLKGKKFKTSLTGFRFKEEAHEASRYLFKKN